MSSISRMKTVLAIDQGTTNTKALLISESGNILARASVPLVTSYPNAGWAEQSAVDIWTSVKNAIAKIIDEVGLDKVDAIAIANQRETLVVWDAKTSKAICPAIIWQCRRTIERCAKLVADGHEQLILDATGLQINPLFPATKLHWVMNNVPQAKELAAKGNLRAGTVDAWLLWKLTGGTSFKTDHSNASRTQLFDTRTLEFSADLCELNEIPIDCLAEPVASDSMFGKTAKDTTALPAGIPIMAMMGDSHAALYGHGVRKPGEVKATFGTGSSLMTLTPKRIASSNGLSGTIAWTDKDGPTFALEGNITVSGQAAAFIANLIGIDGPAKLSSLAETATDNGGVCFVPALAGLGAPHWDDNATGTITGMTHSTKPAHLALATLEAITHQIADVFEAMEQDVGHPIDSLHADGGASSNDFLMQLQANMLGSDVYRSDNEEVGAFGVAAMAFSNMVTQTDIANGENSIFSPNIGKQLRDNNRTLWANSLEKSLSRSC